MWYAFLRFFLLLINAPMPSALPSTEREGPSVQAMFGAIARRYDLANHLLSGGLDFLWRRQAARLIRKWQPARILDLATGSGDLALTLRRAWPEALVVGADFCRPMLQVARRKGLKNLVVADALQLPFAEGEFDAVTVAFGLRNMASWPAALAEMRRVLRRGGHLLILISPCRKLHCGGFTGHTFITCLPAPGGMAHRGKGGLRLPGGFHRAISRAAPPCANCSKTRDFGDATHPTLKRWDRGALYRQPPPG